MKLENLKENCDYNVLVREVKSKDDYHQETIKFIGTINVPGQYNLVENNTIGYVFETVRGKVLFTSNSNYYKGDDVIYITIYNNYSDNNEYKFVD